ncbi:uncharacterized protein LOC108193810 isoform X1 [Daucus carota subsp. sativus]|uniref:uncharacterized protein LOC108193810 isoform X1 n=1 Tax=Daucus carota subsp. sativus TaxID=79200 RepID=UPI0030833CF0
MNIRLFMEGQGEEWKSSSLVWKICIASIWIRGGELLLQVVARLGNLTLVVYAGIRYTVTLMCSHCFNTLQVTSFSRKIQRLIQDKMATADISARNTSNSISKKTGDKIEEM